MMFCVVMERSVLAWAYDTVKVPLVWIISLMLLSAAAVLLAILLWLAWRGASWHAAVAILML